MLVLGAFGGALDRLSPPQTAVPRARRNTAAPRGRLAESLGGIRIIKAYTAEKREELTFARGAHKLFRNIAKGMTGVSAKPPSLRSSSRGRRGDDSVGGRSVDGPMTLGDLFMYVFFTGLMALPLIQFAAIGTQITEAFAGLDRIREVMNMATEDADDAGRAPLAEVSGEVEFENVWFEYNEGVPVLKNVSFKAPAGSTTALVGSSGSGKSTLTSLVMHFNRPLSGTIRIDGRDLRSLRLRDFRSHLGVVMQDNFLFDWTLAEHRFSNPHSTRADIQAVAASALRRFSTSSRRKRHGGGQRGRGMPAGSAAHRHRPPSADPKFSSRRSPSRLDSESELWSGRAGQLRAGARPSLSRTAFKFAAPSDSRDGRRSNLLTVTHEDCTGRGRYKQSRQSVISSVTSSSPRRGFTPAPARPLGEKTPPRSRVYRLTYAEQNCSHR